MSRTLHFRDRDHQGLDLDSNVVLNGSLAAPAATASGATVHQALTDINALLGSGSAASAVTIADAGSYYTATNVETALQELASKDLGYTAHGNTGSTETFSALTGWHSATLDANCTFTFSGATSGLAASMVLELAQDGTGSRLVTWPGSVVWPGGTAPTLSTTAGHVDVILFMSRDGGTTWYGFPTGGGGGVTSVALTTPAEFSVAGSPVTTSGTLAVTKATQSANTVWAGPTTGSAAPPTFRALVAADIPGGVGTTDHVHIGNLAFSGDGSTVAFELPAAPFDAYSVAAYVAGTRTDVTLSGTFLTTMTFASAPASATDNIKVDLIAAAA